MTCAIVDYGSGNLHSAAKAFERVAREQDIRTQIIVSDDPREVRRSERIVLPGVGTFRDCRAGLQAVPGMWDMLREEVEKRAKPFLGICVGMQLMADRGLEHGTTEGFGWIAGEVVRVEPKSPEAKIPHMGWNTLEPARSHPLLQGLSLGAGGMHAYFVHSYHLVPKVGDDLLASTDYFGSVTAMVVRANMAGTQFHPEKSQALGLGLIGNFLRWRP
jgi:imidazole glycerol-phosphate synthase subunit HisH